MKRIIKFLAAFGICSLLSGYLISVAEKRKEKKNRVKEGSEKETHRPYGVYEAYVKRPLDFALALTGLIFLAPVYIGVAVLVRAKLGKPVIFEQERPGKDGKIFKLYKFRTMTNECDEDGKLLPDEERLTAFGKWLRSTSLDELPEFFNILKGDMSLVGPRPLLVEYLPHYNEKEKHRHDVRPGLTGLSQVNGRNLLGWDKRFRLDVLYTRNVSFINDLKIILKTIKNVLKRSDILENTMEAEPNFADERKNGKV